MSKFELKNPDAAMSYKQGIMIRNLGGGDVRGNSLTMQQASDRISELMAAKNGGSKPESTGMSRDEQFEFIWEKALAAGRRAGEEAEPTPMIVSGYEDEPVMGGACGFASVNVKPGTSAFAMWLKKKDHARTDSYEGGVCIWIGDYGQSMARKAAHAAAMAKVFTDQNFRAYSSSRMD